MADECESTQIGRDRLDTIDASWSINVYLQLKLPWSAC